MKKTFQQMRESLLLGEAVMDQKTWDKTKKGDKLTIGFDSGIKKGNKVTFVVGTKNIVGKAKVGKITMKREDGKGGKFFLYNRNGNISLALGDMAASMTSMVKESVEVELEEASASVYKDMPKAPGKMVSNRVQVKAFKDTNAMGAFLSKQNDNSWQQTGVAGLKSGKYKIDMVKKGGKPSKNFIKVNEEVELDEGAKTHFVFQKGVVESKSRVHVGTEQSCKDWIKKNSKHFIHKGKDFVIFKGTYGKVKSRDRLDFKYVAETVELDERNYAKEYANYHSRPEQIANSSSRNQARRIMAKDNDVEGMDVGHKDNNPLNNDPKNLQVEDPSDNRREPRMRNEGTWATPDTPKKKMTLKKILSKPLKAKDAEKAMYSIIGDDELFDAFDEAKPNEDVRSLIKSRMKEMGIKEDLDEGKQAKYPLYHKDFSGAMKTAYDHAKKNLGVIVDPSEIDDKVAMGPRKPSTGKTNSYRLTDKSGKKAIQVQVYNTGKSYELNMYKEDLDFVYEAVVTYEDDYDTIVNITIEKDKFMYAMGRDKPQDIAKRYPWKNSANLILEPTMYKRSRSWDDVHQYLLRFLGNKRGMDSAIRQVLSHNDAPIIYKEEVELDLAEGFSPAQIDKLRKQYKSLPDRLSTDQAMKLGKVLKGMPKDQLIAIARADIKWLSSSAVTNLIIQGVKASEINEEVQLDEAFKAGGLKLKDGKQVLVKKDDAMMLNDLMKQLSKPNVKKMTDTLMKNKKGYAEILGFAKDSHE